MLVFVPVALFASLLDTPPLVLFFLSALAIIPLAKFIGEATDHLARRAGVGVGGLLNATFGNAAELIIAFFALRAGLIGIVKASIIGSIVGNILLVMGASMFAGGLVFSSQKFNRTAVLSSGSTLLLAVIALVMPAIFLLTAPGVETAVIEDLSIAVAVLMIGIYGASLIFSLYTHKHLYVEEVAEYESHWSNRKSLIVLFSSTAAIALMSELLIGAVEPIVQSLGWTEMFIGVIFVAIIGNVAEHSSAILVSIKNRMDLSIQIALGSATQIAMLIAPLLVLLSFFFETHVTLVFGMFELVTVVLAVLIANLVIEDGESNWFEGLQLLTAYIIIGVAFYFHP
ncbi:MAG: Ca2+:H+ antiporter [Parcubacteria group bacterium Gr01-1014_8]|nr:MAG: Ca2+:H+ antiporter [Parcubacteria group bacterium Gr01-1014_8]